MRLDASTRTIRRIKGQSQKALALGAGVTPSVMCEIEMGRRHPEYATARGIAKSLNISLAAWFMVAEHIEAAHRAGTEAEASGPMLREAGIAEAMLNDVSAAAVDPAKFLSGSRRAVHAAMLVIRKHRRLSQDGVAQRIGVGDSAVRDSESGRWGNPSIAKLERMAQGLGVPVSTIFVVSDHLDDPAGHTLERSRSIAQAVLEHVSLTARMDQSVKRCRRLLDARNAA